MQNFRVYYNHENYKIHLLIFLDRVTVIIANHRPVWYRRSDNDLHYNSRKFDFFKFFVELLNFYLEKIKASQNIVNIPDFLVSSLRRFIPIYRRYTDLFWFRLVGVIKRIFRFFQPPFFIKFDVFDVQFKWIIR